MRRIPSLEGILAQEGEDGKLHYDDDAVEALFDKYTIAEQYRSIFDKTQSYSYESISEFRVDLEKLIFLKPTQNICSCTEIIELLKDVKRLEKLILDLAFLLRKL